MKKFKPGSLLWWANKHKSEWEGYLPVRTQLLHCEDSQALEQLIFPERLYSLLHLLWLYVVVIVGSETSYSEGCNKSETNGCEL